jgi:hypothetical protein
MIMDIEEAVNHELIRRMLKEKEAVFFSKEIGSDVLIRREGTVLEVEPLERIAYKNDLVEVGHLPFCGTTEGILLILDKKMENVFYRNDKVLEAYVQRGYDDFSPIQFEDARKNLSKKGVFYLHPEDLPREIHP